MNEFGNRSLTSLIPSRVFFPASRNSSSPVASVNVKTSNQDQYIMQLQEFHILPSMVLML